MLLRLAVVAVSMGMLSGCASVLKDKTQPIKVETVDQAGNAVVGAKCELKNSRGAFNVETPNTVFVRKSGDELIVTCNAPDQVLADAKLISRVGGAVFGNIILGGGIGAIVDSASGVAFNYPEWVQLVFGKTLTFDRANFKEAEPTIATVNEAEKLAQANTPLAAQPTAPVPQKVEHITIGASDTGSVK